MTSSPDPGASGFAARLAAVWDDYAADRPRRGAGLGLGLVQDHPGHGEAWYAYACCLERLGAWRDADCAFARAARARESPQATPYRISLARFHGAVAAARDALPGDLRRSLDEVAVVIADYAHPAQLAGFAEPELLGLFSGPPRAERHDAGGTMPTIHLWRRAHEHHCHDAAGMRSEIRQTLWHELGHYLGYDEDELDALGRG